MAEDQTITFQRFQQLALESADPETGRVAFPVLRDGMARISWILSMDWHGLIERTGPEKRYYEKTGPWVITDKGRAAAAAHRWREGEGPWLNT